MSIRLWLSAGALIAFLGLALTAKAFYHAKEAAEAKTEVLSSALERAQTSVIRATLAVKDQNRVLLQREIAERDLSATLTEMRRKLREAYRDDQAAAEWAPRRVPDSFLDGLRGRPDRRDGSLPGASTGAPASGEAGA